MTISITKLKVTVFILSLFPVAWLLTALLTHNLGANPIETITRESGLWALRFLVLTLMITPLRALTGWNMLVSIRRMLGLYVFFLRRYSYAAVSMVRSVF
jgi:sulfoxide reductase heme-binding subunit YedZ